MTIKELKEMLDCYEEAEYQQDIIDMYRYER